MRRLGVRATGFDLRPVCLFAVLCCTTCCPCTAAVLDAIQEGQLSHIFLIGGCDAPEPSRKYYTEVVKGLPQDTMVLTLGCGKYRCVCGGAVCLQAVICV